MSASNLHPQNASPQVSDPPAPSGMAALMDWIGQSAAADHLPANEVYARVVMHCQHEAKAAALVDAVLGGSSTERDELLKLVSVLLGPPAPPAEHSLPASPLLTASLHPDQHEARRASFAGTRSVVSESGTVAHVEGSIEGLDGAARLVGAIENVVGQGGFNDRGPLAVRVKVTQSSDKTETRSARTPSTPIPMTRNLTEAKELDAYVVNNYILLYTIGKGAQASVWLAFDRETRDFRAVKQFHIKKRGLNRVPTKAFDCEVETVIACRHQNLVRVYEVIDAATEEHPFSYIVMQWVKNGAIGKVTVTDTGNECTVVEPTLLAAYGVQLCEALSRLHEKKIFHRDIKPENILVGDNANVFLADFGVSEKAESGNVYGTRGTLPFMAPELLTGNQATHVSGAALDVWALGVTLFALLYGRLPWLLTADTYPTRLEEMQKGTIDFAVRALPPSLPPSLEPRQLSETALAEHTKSYSFSAEDAPPATGAETGEHSQFHPIWQQLLADMLCVDCTQRPSLDDVKQRLLAIDAAARQG